MAVPSNLYQRRCRELGIDEVEQVRIGRLVYVCRITSDRNGSVCGFLMLCDCGRFCKVGIHTLRRGVEHMPFECLTCRTAESRKEAQRVRRHKKYLTHKALLKRRREKYRERVGKPQPLRVLYKRTFDVWHNMVYVKKHKVPARWRGTKGFKRFMAEIGEHPGEGWHIGRKDLDHPHSKWNTIWKKQQTPTRRRQRK